MNFILAHSGSSYEVNSDLQGQECYSLCDIQPLGSILTTTTSTVVLVYHGENGGHHGIACRTLKPPQGLLGGIGRRVSSFIWGGTPSGTTGSEAVSFSKAFSIGLALLSNDFFNRPTLNMKRSMEQSRVNLFKYNYFSFLEIGSSTWNKFSNISKWNG